MSFTRLSLAMMDMELPYASRAEAMAAAPPTSVVKISVRASNGLILNYVENPATTYPLLTTADARKWVPAGQTSIEHAGAIGYLSQAEAEAGVDSAAAIQQAVDYQDEIRGGLIRAFGGSYRLTSQITITRRSVGISAEGTFNTTFVIDHTSGAGIRFQRDNPRLYDINVVASTTRAAAAKNASLPGIQVEVEDEPDSTAARTRWVDFRNVRVSGHPGSGIVCVGPQTGLFHNCICSNNKLHGYHFAKSITARVNETGVPGLCEIFGGSVNNNGGHAICTEPLTSVPSPAVRVGIINVEIGGNALDTDVRLWPSEVYLRGAQFSLERNVFVPTTAGIEAWFVSGASIHIINNRYLNCVRAGTISSHVELPTRNVVVDGVQMGDNTQGAFDPLVLVRKESGANDPRGITIRNYSGGTVTRLVATDATMDSAGPQRVPGLTGHPPVVFVKASDQVVNNTETVTDITDLQVWMAAGETIVFDLFLCFTGPSDADLRLQFVDPVDAVLQFGPPSGIKMGALDTIVVGAPGADSDVFTLGTLPSTKRVATITGVCINSGNSGYLRAQFAQTTATVGDTTIYGGLSHLKVWRTM